MPSLPEDLLSVISEELFRNDASLVDFALCSRLTLDACRPLLFETLVFDFHETNGIDHFNDFVSLFRLNPNLASYVRSLTAFDNSNGYSCSLRSSNRHVRLSTYKTQTKFSGFIQLQQAWAALGEILNNFTTLRCLHISIGQPHLLPFKALSPSTDLILRSPYIQHVFLRGLKDLSPSFALGLLRVEDVHLAQCTFAPPGNDRSTCAVPTQGHPTALKTLLYEPISKGARSTDLNSNLCLSSYLDLSSIKHLSLCITNFSGVEDAAATLRALEPKITSLSLDTSGFFFSSLRSRLSAPFLEDDDLTHINSAPLKHVPGICPQERNKATEMDTFTAMFARLFQGESISADGQFSRMMSKLALYQTFHQLKRLSLCVSFWQHCFDTESNGEMYWAGNVFRGLNHETAGRLEDIEVKISLATDNCLENVETLSEMASYEGWTIWDEALSDRKWTSLRKFKIIVQTSILCVQQAKEDCKYAIEDLRDELPRLEDKEILEIDYEFTDP